MIVKYKIQEWYFAEWFFDLWLQQVMLSYWICIFITVFYAENARELDITGQYPKRMSLIRYNN